MSRLRTCFFALALIICATPSLAGTLASDSSSYLGTWNGSTAYADGALNGTIEWAVYAPGTFPVAFTGFSPNPNNLVYAYQVFEVGTADLSSFSVGLFGPASPAAGYTFTGGGVSGTAPTGAIITSGSSAIWSFGGLAGDGVNATTSVGLAFESPKVPTNSIASVADTGLGDSFFPVPGTSTISIPEPATITLAFVGFLGLFGVWLPRGRRR